MSRTTKVAALAAAAAAFAALAAAPEARAHVTLEASSAAANSTHRAVFRVPHGCEGHRATTRLVVELPEGVTGARPMPKPGWTLRIEPRGEARAAGEHGAAPAEAARIVWEGGRLEDAHYDEFVVRFRVPDAPGTTLWFPVTQGCEDGSTAAWVEVPAEGRRASDYRYPAPALRVTARSN